jgi:hypothetical protein
MSQERAPTVIHLNSASPEWTEKDLILARLERAEKRVVACSFLVAKIVSVLALLLTLLLLETGVVIRVWETEFGPHSQAVEILLQKFRPHRHPGLPAAVDPARAYCISFPRRARTLFSCKMSLNWGPDSHAR